MNKDTKPTAPSVELLNRGCAYVIPAKWSLYHQPQRVWDEHPPLARELTRLERVICGLNGIEVLR